MGIAAATRRGQITLRCLRCVGIVSAALISHTVNAQIAVSEPLERIVEVTREFLLAALNDAERASARIEISQLDSRLRLTRCAHIPVAQLAPGTRSVGNGTVNVRCTEPVAWSIFIPVRVEREQTVVVVARTLARQQIIQADDVRLEPTLSNKLANGYFDALDTVIGLQAKRALTPGQVLNDALLSQPKLVKRGQQVTLFAVRPGLTVQMKGEALEDGTVGQRIQVRNRTSKQIVEGYVELSGAIRLGL